MEGSCKNQVIGYEKISWGTQPDLWEAPWLRSFSENLFRKSVLSFGLAVWLPTSIEGRIQIEKAQRFALRTLQRNYSRDYSELLRVSRLLPVGFTAASYRCRLAYLWHRELHYWPDPQPLTQTVQVRRAQRLQQNAHCYELPAWRLNRSDCCCVREALHIWNRMPTEWADLEKKEFYLKLKQRDLMEGLLAPFHQYSAFRDL